jgi:hypothetical protein
MGFFSFGRKTTGRTRQRDGHVFATGSVRRRTRKYGELSARSYRRVVRNRRDYHKGRPERYRFSDS